MLLGKKNPKKQTNKRKKINMPKTGIELFVTRLLASEHNPRITRFHFKS